MKFEFNEQQIHFCVINGHYTHLKFTKNNKMTQKPRITICMPVYNTAAYLKECIDSILSQSFIDFELLIGDDGSTDNSADIVSSYSDPRIHFFKFPHDYIGTLNALLNKAKGKYIARMDSDDVMHPDRLAIQYEYMETHPNVDLLGGRMAAFRENPNKTLHELYVKDGRVTLSDLIDGCCICHPTIMFRARAINTPEKVRYNKEMVYAEDYDLWVRLLSRGKKIYNTPKILAYYRLHNNQVTACHLEEQIRKATTIREKILAHLSAMTDEAFNEYVDIPNTKNKLTVVMPFLNEGEEVGNTVRNIRATAGKSVDIIVINDDSDDNYDYERDLAGLGIIYVVNKHRLGAALSKERGVQLSKTPYFILLDAHMRFYEKNWVDYIVEELEYDSQRLLCSKSIPLNKDKEGKVFIVPNFNSPKGAYISFNSKKHVPSIDWNYYEDCLPTCTENQIPCVLGAGYTTSKSYWNKIRGLQGLIHYGCEEAYISIKAWKEGGGCYLLPRLSIGHIYRQKFPYSVYSFQHIYNYLLISELLFPTSERFFAKAVAWQLGKKSLHTAMEYMAIRKRKNNELKEYYKLLNNNNFTYVKGLNDICRRVAQNSIRISNEDAEKTFTYVQDKFPLVNGIGLFDGMSGILLAALLYAEFSHKDLDTFVQHIWDKLTDELSKEHNLSFQTGFAGVGWALIYAASHKLIEDDIESELSLIDHKIMTMSIKRNSDLSFLNGLGGIYCYVTARLGFAKRNNTANSTLTSDFLEELDDEVIRVIEKSEDWRTKNFASQYAERKSKDWEILAPEFQEIVELSDYIPKSQDQWSLSLLGITGTIINKITNEYKQ